MRVSSKEIPKKLILAVLSAIFLIAAPIAINTFIIGQLGVRNTISSILEGIASETLSSNLQYACGKQAALAYADCESLALAQVCPQYADEKSCENAGGRGREYFVKNVLLPNALPKVYDYTIPGAGIKVGELDAVVKNAMLVSLAFTIIAVILMIMLIGTPEGILKVLGANIFWTGFPMFLFAYGANGIMPSMLSGGLKELDPETTKLVIGNLKAGLKPFIDADMQIGIVLAVIGITMLAARHILFREKKGILQK